MSAPSHPNSAAKFGAKPETFEEAVYTVVHESGPTPKQLASAIGVTHGYILHAANPSREDAQFQGRLIVPLTKASGNDAIVEHIAREVGGLFVRLAPAGQTCDAQTAKSLSEFGDYLKAVAESQADGVVTEAEFAYTSVQIDEVIAAILAHREALRARVVHSSTQERSR